MLVAFLLGCLCGGVAVAFICWGFYNWLVAHEAGRDMQDLHDHIYGGEK